MVDAPCGEAQHSGAECLHEMDTHDHEGKRGEAGGGATHQEDDVDQSQHDFGLVVAHDSGGGET